MKKNLIALAVASAMVAPAAMAEVKVSGTLQAEIVSVSGDSAVNNGLYLMDGATYANPNGHNAGALGFSASHDLGNGLTGFAKANFNVQADNNAAMGTRDAYVGLKGGFGTVMAGRLSTPYKSSTVKWDPFFATFMQARGNKGVGGGLLGNGSYLANAVAYANKFGPAKVVIAAGFDETAEVDALGAPTGNTQGNHATSISINAPVGPVEVAVAMLNASDYAATGPDANNMKVGVKYSAGAITVAAVMENSDASADNGTYTWVNGAYKMGANTFSLGFGQFAADTGSVDGGYLAVGMKHAFSKKVSAHVGYRSTTNDTAPASTDESLVGAGLRVSF